MRTQTFERIGHQVEHLKTIDSTNNYLKQKALLGAPHGLVVVADEQTGGRGRLGRNFQSPKGKGLYFSVLLRPCVPATQITALTPWAAVAVCRGLETLTGLRPDIKWINDIQLKRKKLCGILTEADIAPDGTLNHVILGIGLNVAQTDSDFTPEVAAIATSLARHLPQPPSREELLAVLLAELERMWEDLPEKQEEYLAAYRARCITVGRDVTVISPQGARPGFARKLNKDFSLLVEFPDGTAETIGSGEVSVRNMD